MSLLYFPLAIMSAIAFFLGSRHHQWRRTASLPWRWRIAGSLQLIAAWAAAWQELGLWGGGFAMLTAFMLAAVGVPYLHAWWRSGHAESRHVG